MLDSLITFFKTCGSFENVSDSAGEYPAKFNLICSPNFGVILKILSNNVPQGFLTKKAITKEPANLTNDKRLLIKPMQSPTITNNKIIATIDISRIVPVLIRNKLFMYLLYHIS